jgi:hypothetical protein
VDIGTAQVAQLSQYAFEGATKQMKPRLEVSCACLPDGTWLKMECRQVR